MPSSNIVIDPAKVVQFVQATSVFGKRAMDKLAVAATAEKQASDLRPAVLQSLLDAGAIEPEQKEAADKALSSHAQTLQLLKNAAAKLSLNKTASTKTAGDRLGHAENEQPKQAAEFDSLSSPFVGQRTGIKKASDRAFLAGLGIESD